MAKIAILGSNGTLGKVFVKELEHHEVLGVTRSMCDLADNVSVKNLLTSEKFDAVVLCATNGGKQSLGNFNITEFVENLIIFQNLKECHENYGVLINIGSGAEFDLSFPISMAKESEICDKFPRDGYGLSKNLISRQILEIPNAITLRAFGCFDPSEPEFRLLRKFIDSVYKNEMFYIDYNKWFSFISAIDLANIIDQTILKWRDLPKDINCAYKPITIEWLLGTWCGIHKISHERYKIVNDNGLEYTCNIELMQTHFTIKNGLYVSLEKYI